MILREHRQNRSLSPHLLPILEAALREFEAAYASLAAWEAREAPVLVAAVMHRLQCTRTRVEFLAELRTIVGRAGHD